MFLHSQSRQVHFKHRRGLELTPYKPSPMVTVSTYIAKVDLAVEGRAPLRRRRLDGRGAILHRGQQAAIQFGWLVGQYGPRTADGREDVDKVM
jgi:hypothetical protein